ncbi:hypothetical protein [Tenacibaculum sp. nBUS_03]|uniref:hypothetical protein n=1 Tax=Tenacibaculum sp. nBUS_03 TaxID=3395320 RepID=UPI003EBBC4E8
MKKSVILTKQKENTFKNWVKEGVTGAIRDKTVGAMTGLVFDSTLGALGKAIFGSLITNPKPGYMIELQNIETKLDQMDDKLNTLISFSEEIVLGIDKIYRKIVADRIYDDLFRATSITYEINSLFVRFNKYGTFNREYNVNNLWKYAVNPCKFDDGYDWNCETKTKDLISLLGGDASENKIELLCHNFQKNLDTAIFLDLNKNFQEALGELVYDDKGKLSYVKLNHNVSDITVPWNAVNKAINKLTVTYYNALSQLYYMQALQLAFYYAQNERFSYGLKFIDPLWVEGTNPSKDGLLGFEKAFNKMTAYFTTGDDGFGHEMEHIFGSKLGNSVIKNQIPSLKDFVQAAINNRHMFSDDLLSTCAIKSVYMPTLGGNKTQYFNGRLEMVALFEDTNNETQQIGVGHDIPYASLSDTYNTRIGHTCIDGFKFIKDDENSRLEALKYTHNLNDWVPSEGIQSDAIPVIMGTAGSISKPWEYFQGYTVKMNKELTINDKYQCTNSFDPENKYSRNTLGKMKGNTIHYAKNTSKNSSRKERTTQFFNQPYLVLIKKTGSLFFLMNEFPAIKFNGTVPKAYYAQFIRPIPFEYVEKEKIEKYHLNLSNPFSIKNGDLLKEKSTFNKENINIFKSLDTGVIISTNLELTTTNNWYLGGGFILTYYPDYKKSDVFSSIEINPVIPKNYIFSSGKYYQKWIDSEYIIPNNTIFLDGKLSYSRSNKIDKPILKSSNNLYSLVFTTEGELEIRKKGTPQNGFTLFDSKKTDELIFTNGNIFFDKIGIVSSKYDDQKLRWISDPFATLTLENDGSLIMKGSSTPLLGSQGVIWSSNWKNEGWPEINN